MQSLLIVIIKQKRLRKSPPVLLEVDDTKLVFSDSLVNVFGFNCSGLTKELELVGE